MENANTKKAFEFIREKILEGLYPPGYRLQTVDLAAEVGVSRTPVRDALRLLESEGLVKISPRLGASVRTLNSTEFREMCELRLALESLAAELAARNRGPEDIMEIQDAVETMDAAVVGLRTDPDSKPLKRDLMRQDLRFHFAVLKAARNNLVRAEILRLHLLNRVVWMSVTKVTDESPDKGEDFHARLLTIQESHRRIFFAIKAQEVDAARKAMHDHMTELMDRSMRAMVRFEKKRELSGMDHEDAPFAYEPHDQMV